MPFSPSPTSFDRGSPEGDSADGDSEYDDPNMRRGRPRADVVNSLIYQGSMSNCSIRCEVCNRVFPREKSLQAHMRTHTGKVNKYQSKFKSLWIFKSPIVIMQPTTFRLGGLNYWKFLLSNKSFYKHVLLINWFSFIIFIYLPIHQPCFLKSYPGKLCQVFTGYCKRRHLWPPLTEFKVKVYLKFPWQKCS